MKKMILSLTVSIATLISFNPSFSLAQANQASEQDAKLIQEFHFLKQSAQIIKDKEGNSFVQFKKSGRYVGEKIVAGSVILISTGVVVSFLKGVAGLSLDYISYDYSLNAIGYGALGATVGGAIMLVTSPSDIGDSTMTGYLLKDENIEKLLSMSDVELLSVTHSDSRISNKILAIATIVHGEAQ